MHSDSLLEQGMANIDTKELHKDLVLVRRKPGRPPKQHPPGTINGIIAECAVCHDRATGLHYAVMTCEGCKGFFKRSIQADKAYKCKKNGACIVSKDTRNTCQACRMQRCFDMGMMEKLVRDDRTPGNRKKKCTELSSLEYQQSSDKSDNASDYVKREATNTVKLEGTCNDHINNLSIDRYPVSRKRRYDNYIADYGGDFSAANFSNISISSNSMNREFMFNDISPMKDLENWEFSRIASESMLNFNTTDAIHHTCPVFDHPLNAMDNFPLMSINCSGDQELPLKKCKQNPRCLMHLLTRLIKAKPVEPAFCKYFERYPTSEQFLDCLADEIHLIIKFAKKTPGFCELTMGRKLSVVQKHALSILFIRIIYRSMTCPLNHVQFASNICLNYNDFERVEILSRRFCQTIMELIASFKSLNLDIYELCLIQYAIIEDEDWDPEIRYYPLFDGFDRPTSNISQKYLKLYTSNKYPDQPHRWVIIMLSLSHVHDMVKIFISQCTDLVNAQKMAISNDILKEILSI